MGEWVAEHGIESPGRAPRRAGAVAAPTGARAIRRHGRSAVPAGRRRRSTPLVRRRCRRWTAAAWRSRARPARARRTSARRSIVELVRRGRKVGRHRQQPQGHRQSARLGRRARPSSAACEVRIGQKTDMSGRLHLARRGWLTGDNGELLEGHRGPARSTSSAARPGSGRGPSSPLVWTLCSSTRPVSCRSPTSSPSRPPPKTHPLGDPQQLDQPLRARTLKAPTSPRSPTFSTVGPTPSRWIKGLFLEHTWRLHPELSPPSPPRCSMTASSRSKDGLNVQTITSRSGLLSSEHGLRFMPVEHTGNQNCSPEEAEPSRPGPSNNNPAKQSHVDR